MFVDLIVKHRPGAPQALKLFRDADVRAVLGLHLVGTADQLKVFDGAVLAVAVLELDNKAIRNRPIMLFPYDSVFLPPPFVSLPVVLHFDQDKTVGGDYFSADRLGGVMRVLGEHGAAHLLDSLRSTPFIDGLAFTVARVSFLESCVFQSLYCFLVNKMHAGWLSLILR